MTNIQPPATQPVEPDDAFNAIRWVFKHSKAKYADRLVLMVIAMHADGKGKNSFPKQGTIAEEAGGLSVRQVQRAIKNLKAKPLEELGWERRWVHTPSGLRRLNVYWLPKMEGDNLSGTQGDNLSGSGEDVPDISSEVPDISFGGTSKEPPKEPPKDIAPASPSLGEVIEGEIVETDDDLMNALEDVLGNAPRDKKLRGAWNVARRQLAEQGATADRIREVVPAVRRIPKINSMAMTPTALAKHWGQIGSEKVWELLDWKDQAVIAAWEGAR
jgi:hypothetical protein